MANFSGENGVGNIYNLEGTKTFWGQCQIPLGGAKPPTAIDLKIVNLDRVSIPIENELDNVLNNEGLD